MLLIKTKGTKLLYYTGGRGHWDVNYTGTQNFIVTLSLDQLWVLLLNYDWLVNN